MAVMQEVGAVLQLLALLNKRKSINLAPFRSLPACCSFPSNDVSPERIVHGATAFGLPVVTAK